MPPEIQTLDQFRENLERQNIEKQIQQNLAAQQTFGQTQSEAFGFTGRDRSKGPAFQRVVSQTGQKTPEEIQRENELLNRRLVALGGQAIPLTQPQPEVRRFAPARPGQNIVQGGVPGQPGTQQAGQIGTAFRATADQNGQIGTAFRASRQPTVQDYIDGLVDGFGNPIQPGQQPTEVAGVAFQRLPNGEVVQIRGEGAPTTPAPQPTSPTPPVQQPPVSTAPPTGGATQPTSQVQPVSEPTAPTQPTSQQVTTAEATPTSPQQALLTSNQINQFRDTDNVHKERVANAYSNLNEMLNQNNTQFASLLEVVDQDEKNRMIEDQAYYTSVYGPGGQAEQLNEQFYTGLENFINKRQSEQQALARALAQRSGSTPAQAAAELNRIESQNLEEILQVRQQQLQDIKSIQDRFIDLEARFRQEHANSTDKNIVETYRRINDQKNQLAATYTEAIRQFDNQLSALELARQGRSLSGTGTTGGAGDPSQLRLLSEAELAALTPDQRREYEAFLRGQHSLARSFAGTGATAGTGTVAQ